MGIFFYSAAIGNITSVSALIFLTPVFALLFSGFLLGEHLTKLQWIGVVFTLISVYLVNQREELVKKFAGADLASLLDDMAVSEPVPAIPEAIAADISETLATEISLDQDA